jgi:glycogen(starch) synthase
MARDPFAKTQTRMVFTMGPGDIVTSFQQWLDGDKLGGAPALTYTAQTLDFCQDQGCAGWLISSCEDGRLQEAGTLRVENRPKPRVNGGGLAFHWQQWLYCLSLVRSAKAFRATHLVVDSGTTHWFMLFLAVWSGMKVFVSFHNTYYTVGRWRGSRSRNAIRWLDGLFFKWGSSGALGVSQECGKQYVELGGRGDRFFLYNALFRANDFSAFQAKSKPAECFHVLYVGRLEVDKGAIDLLNAVQQTIKAHPTKRLQLSYCGSGPASALIKEALQTHPELADQVNVLGHLNRDALLKAYQTCDAVVVPTTSWFMEGFPKVGAEAMLSRRPLIISDAVPTVHGLTNASMVYRADDPADLARAIESLWMGPDTYQRLAEATESVARNFTDPSKGLCAALVRATQ